MIKFPLGKDLFRDKSEFSQIKLSILLTSDFEFFEFGDLELFFSLYYRAVSKTWHRGAVY